MSIWASIVTFDDYNDDATGLPPIVYSSNARPPVLDDARGGQFDVAAVPGFISAVNREIPGLRFATTTGGGQHAVVILDGFQVAQLIGKCTEWLEGQMEPFVVQDSAVQDSGGQR